MQEKLEDYYSIMFRKSVLLSVVKHKVYDFRDDLLEAAVLMIFRQVLKEEEAQVKT
jgi:hypothetical protein